MKPFFNLEDNIGKTVGRRQPPKDSFAYGMGLQKSLVGLARAFDLPQMPKGAFKFHSFEEADAWMMKHRMPTKTK